MHEIQLDDQLFREAQRRATESGFGTVDEYVADVLQHELQDAEDLDHLFTPERLALIDSAAAQIDVGQGLTSDQVRDHFQKRHGA